MMQQGDHRQKALECLAASERDFAAGDDRKGAEELWGAAKHVLTAAAQRRGWGCATRKDLFFTAHWLAEELEEPLVKAGFLSADKFREHVKHGDMEDFEIEIDGRVVYQFVRWMVEKSMAEQSG